MPHRPHCGTCERVVAAKDVDFRYSSVGADHCFQADFSGQGWIRRNRVAKAALGRFCNLQAFPRS
jgi:hypothetical protein